MQRVNLLVLLVPAVVVAAALIGVIAWRTHDEHHNAQLQAQLNDQNHQQLTRTEERVRSLSHELDRLQATIPPLVDQVGSLTRSVAESRAQALADQARWKSERAHLTSERDQARKEASQLRAQLQAAQERIRGLTAALAEARAAAETAEERSTSASASAPLTPATPSTTSPASR